MSVDDFPALRLLSDVAALQEANEKSLEWRLDEKLCEAIARGDEEMARARCFHVQAMLPYKEKAILAGRPQILKALMEYDSSVTDSLIIAAGRRKDCECMEELLRHDWCIKSPVCYKASVLW